MNIVEYAKMRKMFGGGSGGGDLDALIDGSITEIKSNAKSVRSYAFYRNPTLVSVIFPKATMIDSYAFSYCTALENVEFPNLTSPISTLGNEIFSGCTKLKRAYLPKAPALDQNMFYNCTALTELYAPLLTTINSQALYATALTSVNFPLVTNMQHSVFSMCKSLTSVALPSLKMINGGGVFKQCYLLSRADLGLLTSAAGLLFSDCYSLTALVLRSETMCTLANTNAFTNCYHFHGTADKTYNPDGLKDGYIYVPRALIDSYKAATNWVTFADQFRALEDYTVDGTTTGELDESKVSL